MGKPVERNGRRGPQLPALTGLTLPMTEFIERAAEKIPNFAGVKYSHYDLGEFSECRELVGDRYEMLFGRDELLLPALAVGAGGVIGSTFNFSAPIYLRVVAAFQDGDLDAARKAQLEARQMIRSLVRSGPLAGQKAAMRLLGIDCGPARPPLVNPTPTEIEILKNELAALGL